MDALRSQLIFTAGALLCAGIASFHDVRTSRIPNLLTGTAIAIGLFSHAVDGGWRGLGGSALAGLLAGAIVLLFFLAGGMGAGDVKLMVAVGTIVGLSPLGLVLLSTAVTGAVFAIAVSLYHGRLRDTLSSVVAVVWHHRLHGLKPHPDLNLDNPQALSLPFALPVAGGCLLTLCALIWGARP